MSNRLTISWSSPLLETSSEEHSFTPTMEPEVDEGGEAQDSSSTQLLPSSSQLSSGQTFYGFLLLPQEIKDMIWNFSIANTYTTPQVQFFSISLQGIPYQINRKSPKSAESQGKGTKAAFLDIPPSGGTQEDTPQLSSHKTADESAQIILLDFPKSILSRRKSSNWKPKIRPRRVEGSPAKKTGSWTESANGIDDNDNVDPTHYNFSSEWNSEGNPSVYLMNLGLWGAFVDSRQALVDWLNASWRTGAWRCGKKRQSSSLHKLCVINPYGFVDFELSKESSEVPIVVQPNDDLMIYQIPDIESAPPDTLLRDAKDTTCTGYQRRFVGMEFSPFWINLLNFYESHGRACFYCDDLFEDPTALGELFRQFVVYQGGASPGQLTVVFT